MTKSMQQKYLQAVVFLISCSPALLCHGTLKTSGITEDEKKIILQEHNKLRQLVATGEFPGQPSAENMQEIVWDNELANRAQQWANNCEFRHDPSRTIKRFTMGQNLAIIWSTAPLEPDDGDFPSRIRNWFNEVQKYSFGASWSPKTGHYSQLVWGETNLIGCGFSEYKDKAKYNKLYVCNYGPGGNVVGYNPYEVGKPSCKNYGMDPSPRYKGLCMDHTLSPSNGTVSNKISTYEQKQNTLNSKTTYKTSIFNNQQLPQQAEIQIQLANKQQNAIPLPVLISTLFKQQPTQAKTETTTAQRQQETKYLLSHTQSLRSQQPYSRTNISPNIPSSSSSGQEQQEEKQQHFVVQYRPQPQVQVHKQSQAKAQQQRKPELQIQSLPNIQTKTQPQPQPQPEPEPESELQPQTQPQEQQEPQLQQQHQVEIITLETSPNTVISKSSTKTGWSYFTSRDAV